MSNKHRGQKSLLEQNIPAYIFLLVLNQFTSSLMKGCKKPHTAALSNRQKTFRQLHQKPRLLPKETQTNKGSHLLFQQKTQAEKHILSLKNPQMGALTPIPLPSSSQAMQEFPCRIPTTLSLSLSLFFPSLGLHLHHRCVEQQTQHCKGNAIHHRVKNTISNPNRLKEASRFPGLTKAAGWLLFCFEAPLQANLPLQ